MVGWPDVGAFAIRSKNITCAIFECVGLSVHSSGAFSVAEFHPFLCASGVGRRVQPALHHYRHASREGVFAIKVFDAFVGLELFHENHPSVHSSNHVLYVCAFCCFVCCFVGSIKRNLITVAVSVGFSFRKTLGLLCFLPLLLKKRGFTRCVGRH